MKLVMGPMPMTLSLAMHPPSKALRLRSRNMQLFMQYFIHHFCPKTPLTWNSAVISIHGQPKKLFHLKKISINFASTKFSN
jgi:hypothetical protein